MKAEMNQVQKLKIQKMDADKKLKKLLDEKIGEVRELINAVSNDFGVSNEEIFDRLGFFTKKVALRREADTMNPIDVGVKLLSDDAKIPEKAHQSDAGFDLFATQSMFVYPGMRASIGTGIAFDIPDGWECQIRPRSGLAYFHGLTVVNSPGTIDSGYKGEIKVLIGNTGTKGYKINEGEKIAQAVFKRVPSVRLVIVDDVGDSERGEGGFGSSGV